MIGQTISHYKILEKLGEGGMGVVYKARDVKLDRFVALKFLPSNTLVSPEEIARLEQEAKAISSLNHPNIATIHDVGEHDGQKFLVLEYISGGTLRSKIQALQSSGKTLSPNQIIEYGLAIAEGLGHAHRHGIIHRDVKTDNMMLTEEGKIKITDFGLAILRGSSRVTKSGSVVGTAAYMSPEQIRGENVDQRSDLFAYGIVLYELATGQRPFRGEHDVAVSYSIVNEDPLPLKSLNPAVSPLFEKIIQRCLEKEKGKRYQNAEEIVVDLQNVQQEIIGSGSSARPPRRLTRKHVGISLFALALILICTYIFLPSEGSLVETASIAVLPFQNLSADKENEYFSDGITEDITAQLSKIGKLKVISRTSAMRYKNSDKSLKDIGGELNATTILEGSVRKEGNSVRIVAQLIDTRTDNHLWAATYDKELTHIFSIQQDVAEKIANALNAIISKDERNRLEKKSTDNLEAYDFYLQGRFYWNKRFPKDLHKSVDYFNQALQKDPAYALAYSGLADAYVILGDYNILSPTETYSKAKEAAMKALELDPELPEAHISLAYTLMHYDWDWSGSEREFIRAITLAPNSAQAHSWYALFLSLMGRFDEAATHSKRALELDPNSPVIRTDVGLTLYFSRKYTLAIEQFNKALEIDPTFVLANIPLSGAYIKTNMFSEAIVALQRLTAASAIVTSSAHPIPIAALTYVYGSSGRTDDALTMLELLEEKSKEEYVAPYWIGIAYTGIGDTKKAFEWLEKAYREKDGSMIFLKVEPLLDTLRSDPHYTSLFKKMGFEK